MSDDVPVVRDLEEQLHTPPPVYTPEDERATFMGFRRPDGRVGTRNFILIVPTSMCASHEAQQISMISEFTLYKREVSQRRWGRGYSAQQGLRLSGWFNDRSDAANAFELRGSS